MAYPGSGRQYRLLDHRDRRYGRGHDTGKLRARTLIRIPFDRLPDRC